MSLPYIGEIRMFGGNFAPRGWALCDGQLLPIASNDALFSLVGTFYGGDGRMTFGLPDLRGRVPLHMGSGFAIGQKSGSETVTLTTQQLPSHSHLPQADGNAATLTNPAGDFWASSNNYTAFAPGSGDAVSMNAGTISAVGGSQSHQNMLPFQGINFIIALQGVYPSRS